MHNFFARIPAILLLAATTLAAQTPAAGHIDEILASQSRTYRVGQVAISPDGKRLAWVEGARSGILHVAPVSDLKKDHTVTAAAKGTVCGANAPLWVPDSSALVFLSSCDSAVNQQDLYLDKLDGQPARRLSALTGEVQQPVIAPDGRSIAFLYVPGATRPAGAQAAMNAPQGVIGEEGIEVQRVATIPIASAQPAEPSFSTPANLHVYEFDWSPDSKSLAYVAANPPGENNWWVARLYAQTLGGEPHVVLDPPNVSGALHGLQIAVPRWSPDQKFIAFIGGLMSDQGVTGGDLWVVPSAGGEPANLTPGRTSTVEWFTWGGSSIFLSELAGGDARIVRLALAQSAAGLPAGAGFSAPLMQAPCTIQSNGLAMSLSPTADQSLFVFRMASFTAPPEIFTVRAAGEPNAQPRQISSFNHEHQLPASSVESLSWSSDNFSVQGWLLRPANYDPHKKYPMIVEVHGGPSAAETAHWGGYLALSPAAFAAAGYFVLLPNPRGSFGQGEAFTQANRKDFGYGDLRDILVGVDAAVAKYPIDPNRVGLTGWSYGGFMTMFAVTQTHRFKAAVAGAGISNWQSYYGENSIDQWMIPFFGASVYDDPAIYAKSSAINYIKNVTTPTLIVVGDRDGECPAPQSFEMWHALRDQHVPTQLVVYPNEGHGFTNPAHSRDVLERAIDWFNRNMPQ